MSRAPASAERAISGVDLAGLDDLIGFQMRQAQGVLVQQFITALAPLDLTQRQYGTLWLIGANPGVAQISLGGALRMDRASTMVMVDRLEARGLVERKRSTIDRRRQELYLTSDGERFLAQARDMVRAREAGLDERFTPEERRLFMEFLSRLQGVDA